MTVGHGSLMSLRPRRRRVAHDSDAHAATTGNALHKWPVLHPEGVPPRREGWPRPDVGQAVPGQEGRPEELTRRPGCRSARPGGPRRRLRSNGAEPGEAPLRSERRRRPGHRGEQICILGAGLLFVAAFLPWYRLTEVAAATPLVVATTHSGWSTGHLWSTLPVVAGIGIGVVSYRRLRGRSLPDVGLPWPTVILAVSLIIGYVMALRFVEDWAPGAATQDQLERAGFVAERGAGLFLAMLATALLILGAVLQVREARSSSDGPRLTRPEIPGGRGASRSVGA